MREPVLWSTLTLLAVAQVVGCHEPGPTPEVVFPAEHIPEVSFGRLTLTPGATQQEVTVAGQVRQVIVVAPEAIGRNHPLVVYLHGAMRTRGATGRVGPGSHELLMRCLFADEFRTLAPIILMPISTTGTGGEWWTESESSFVVALVDAAKRSLPIHPAHTVVAGFSNGGIGAWTIVRLYPERFSAAIPMAFDAGAVGETRVPVFAIQGTKDELFDYQLIEKRIMDLQRRGQPITFVSKYRGTHFRGCDYASEVAKAGRWLTSVVWAAAPNTDTQR